MMLDVHAPEHRIGGFRDFLIHLLTITVGLLIAVGIEQSVEAVHHRNQRKEAELLIREEIRQNQKTLLENAKGLMDEINGMKNALQSLAAISDGHSAKLMEEELQFKEGPMHDSAWRTATTTGVVSYMDYEEVEKFSDAYKEQDQLQAMEQLALNDYLQLVPILVGSGGHPNAEHARDALPYARNATGHLSGIYFIGRGTLEAYDSALK